MKEVIIWVTSNPQKVKIRPDFMEFNENFFEFCVMKIMLFSIFLAYCQNKHSLASLCSYITGDALLYSMFREEAVPVPCPFHGPLTFSYNRGHGLCSSPQSNVDTCTDDSKLLFRYQACPDVHGSESSSEFLIKFN